MNSNNKVRNKRSKIMQEHVAELQYVINARRAQLDKLYKNDIIVKLNEWAEISRNVANKITGNTYRSLIATYMSASNNDVFTGMWIFGSRFAVKDMSKQNEVSFTYYLQGKDYTTSISLDKLLSTDTNGIARNARLTTARLEHSVLETKVKSDSYQLEENKRNIEHLTQQNDRLERNVTNNRKRLKNIADKVDVLVDKTFEVKEKKRKLVSKSQVRATQALVKRGYTDPVYAAVANAKKRNKNE